MRDEDFQTENDVMIGKDGELYLASGGHKALDYALGRRIADPAAIDAFHSNITARTAFHRDRGLKYLHVIFPDKQSVVTERFVTQTPVRLGEVFTAGLPPGAPVLYPLDVLRSMSSPAFLRTDTHLTNAGTIAVVCEIVARLTGRGIDPEKAHLLSMLTIRQSHKGDLGSKLMPQRKSDEVFAELRWPKAQYHNDIGGGNNGAVSIFWSQTAMFSERLLWFGDSFGREAVRFLSFFFKEILFLRTPFFHPEFVEQMAPDFVVTENVERYLASCSKDEFRPNFYLFPLLSGHSVSCHPDFAKAFSAITSYPRTPYWEFLSGGRLAAQSQSVGEDATMSLNINQPGPLQHSIDLPASSLKQAQHLGITPNIHPKDFIFHFVKRKWKDDLTSAVQNYYSLGKYSTELVTEISKEVQATKKFTNPGKTWQPTRLLDFASGYGCTSRHLVKAFPNSEVASCDIHGDAVFFNETILNVKSFQSSPIPEKLVLPPQDLIVVMSFFSHMPALTYERWLRALANVLAPDGVLIFTANGFVTERRGTTGVTAGEDGFGFEPRSEQGDLDSGEYGITVSYPKWVFRLLDKIPGLRLSKFQEGHWWAIQDTYVCTKMT